MAILNTIMTAGILIGVWWSVIASHNGDLKEVTRAFKEFIEKNSQKGGK